jgi:hypothetical protein
MRSRQLGCIVITEAAVNIDAPYVVALPILLDKLFHMDSQLIPE